MPPNRPFSCSFFSLCPCHVDLLKIFVCCIHPVFTWVASFFFHYQPKVLCRSTRRRSPRNLCADSVRFTHVTTPWSVCLMTRSKLCSNFQAVAIAKLSYTTPWWDSPKRLIEVELKHLFHPQWASIIELFRHIFFNSVCASDDKLFNRILRNTQHILFSVLHPVRDNHYYCAFDRTTVNFRLVHMRWQTITF